MMKFGILFVTTFILLLVIDFFWIGFLGKKIYLEGMQGLLRYQDGKFNPIIPSALFVYLLIVIGILFFVLPQAGTSWLAGFLYGALFGYIMYGVYNFTCYAILAGWPLGVSMIDLAWGSFLCGSTSAILVVVKRFL